MHTLVSNWNFDVSITCQTLGELLAQCWVTNFIAEENGQQVPLFHSVRLNFVVAGKKYIVLITELGKRLQIYRKVGYFTIIPTGMLVVFISWSTDIKSLYGLARLNSIKTTLHNFTEKLTPRVLKFSLHKSELSNQSTR